MKSLNIKNEFEPSEKQKNIDSTKNGSLAKKKNKIDRKSFAFWWRHFIEFLRTTGFHGYKYIAMETETLIARLIWATAVLVCLIVSIILLLSSWEWVSINPTITVIESTHYPIWKYPYPAVTVCPLDIIRKKSLSSNLRTLILPDNLTLDDVTETLKGATALLGASLVDDEMIIRLKKLQDVINFNNITLFDFMDMVRPKCNNILTRCSWKGSPTRCNSLFQDVRSESGFCCTFNYYAAKSTGASDKKTTFVPQKPRKVAGCGYQTALTILLNISPEEFYTTLHGILGYKVMVHYSFDYPDENAATKFVDTLTENFFAVAPEMTYSTPGIYSYDVKKRKCVFPNEVKLKSFVRYTFLNCMAECRGDFVYDMCGCVPFFLPNNGSLPVCNFSNVVCPYKARKIFYSATPSYMSKKCKCLPDCQQYIYPLELSTGKLVTTNDYNSFSFFKDIKIINHSLAHVYFNDLVTTRFRKDVFMSWHNLLASFGGLLGLFIGFSLVSGFELIYFFTLRVFFDIVHVESESTNKNSIWNDQNADTHNAKFKDKVNKINVISLSNKIISYDDDLKQFNMKTKY